MTGNNTIYSRILNNEKNMELIVDYNDMAVELATLNAEKGANAKYLSDEKVEEAA